mmetsp:Transcript_27918/g.61276  ORF Transcript_27918/g.61276 Transcript_27918/m.61276 type:complete len:257 (+) Transcript_27918:136-906(+)
MQPALSAGCSFQLPGGPSANEGLSCSASLFLVTRQGSQDGGLAAHLVHLGGVHAARAQHLLQAGLLLGQVVHTLLNCLLHQLDVQLGVLLLLSCHLGDLGLGLLDESGLVSCVLELLGNVSQGIHTGKALVRSNLLLQVLQELLGSPGLVVVDGVLLGGGLATGQVLDGGEATDLELVTQRPVSISIDLGDDNTTLQLGVAVDQLSKLLVLRSHPLAVAAPGSVELDEHCLCTIYNLIKVVGCQILNARKALSRIL